MHRADESSEPPHGGGAIEPLRGLLELSRLTRRRPKPLETLRAVATTMSEALGFATVAVNAYRSESDDYEVVVVHGSARAREALLGDVAPAANWAPMLDERFQRHGVYFVPEDSLDERDVGVPSFIPATDPGTLRDEHSWHAGDVLLAPLEGSGGRRYGIVSLDEPSSDRRPDERQLELLGAMAAHASLAIESSSQLAELESVVARNRAVIAGTLDCVIAIDEHDTVIEFNPAAERTLGYAGADVLGRRAADVLVPPAARDDYLSLVASVRADPASGLLGRRIETGALRADGTEIPVELAVTRVQGAEGSGPVLYCFMRDISKRRRTEEQLAYLAYHDPLTGLPNRIMVEQQMELALARAQRANGSAALMFVDLDDFKEVNDQRGHAAGDRLLAAVAARLRGVLRSSDMLARQGGDEFLVLLADLAEDAFDAAEHVGGKLLGALHEPFLLAGAEVRTGASIGISVYPQDAGDIEALLRHADAAMYDAKTAGGGRLMFHRRAEQLGSRRAGISGELRAAIAGGELELGYQPVWKLGAVPQISGAEAVLRWRHPTRGLLEPEQFIHLADQSGTGDQLVDWMIKRCCHDVQAWVDSGLPLFVGLNVSRHQLLAPGFVSRIGSRLSACDLSPIKFAVELTESDWTVDSARTLEVVEELRAAGFAVALDDFGSGWSSLHRLLDLGFDVIKVDARMLVGVPEDQAATGLLRAVFQLASACGVDVVVQGVETAAQLEFVEASGIGHAQGRQLADAMAASELTPLLRAQLVPGPPPRRRSRRDHDRV
ncbi:MAG: putative bifunctional diguanylate cyclase/phosphodiesterase [Solirubrobacteraceae bacterium]